LAISGAYKVSSTISKASVEEIPRNDLQDRRKVVPYFAGAGSTGSSTASDIRIVELFTGIHTHQSADHLQRSPDHLYLDRLRLLHGQSPSEGGPVSSEPT